MARILGLLLMLLTSCGSDKTNFDYKVALDPQWYSLDLPGRESALTAFSSELITAIGKEENLEVGVFQRSWSNLMLGLQDHTYDTICTPMQPHLFYEKLYVFSDIFLSTGPVLVVPMNSPITNLQELSNMEVGIARGSNISLILEKYPAILQRTYDSIRPALEDPQRGVLQAVVMDLQTAQAFTQDLFNGQLKIASAPLASDGVRLLGLHGRSEVWIEKFNRGLHKLRENGTYRQIAQKWGLAVQ